ncbi:MAG: hypothetical protein K0Q89_20 [Thermomicrobiales bacterium]|jgi:hypothetical protein|nr:hypothetical protein [Thermomicrobiales bacterium]
MKIKRFKWTYDAAGLRDAGWLAREIQQKRRDKATEAKKEGRRVERPYSPSRAEVQGMKSKVW